MEIKYSQLILIFFMINIGHGLSVYGQEIDKDLLSLPALQRRDFPLTFDEQLKLELKQDLIAPKTDIRKQIMLSPLQYEVPDFNHNLQHNLNLDKILYTTPMYPLGDNSMLYIYQTNDIMPGISHVYSVTAGLNLQPTENWHINVSNSTDKYRDFTGIYNDYTINASSFISLSDNIGVNIYGSYSTNAMNNTRAGAAIYSPLAPYSYYGGSIEFKITDKFGIEAGMLRQYNTWRRKWENVYYASPKFYK